jgi:predicted ATPase
MISRVRVKNFRCLRDVSVSFDPLTVLVGPNACGKSTLLEALVNRQYTPGDVWQHVAGLRPEVVIDDTDGGESALPVSAELAPAYKILRLDPPRLRQSNQVNQEPALSSDGSNLTNVFASLTRRAQSDVARELCTLVPMFDDVDVQPVHAGWLQLRFHDRWADVWYEPHEVSDGTLLALALLLLQRQKSPVDVLAIEEPERGLHPWLLGEVIKILRGMTRGEIGPRKMQIILATHSAELLEFVEPQEVRFFGRDTPDGSVRVTEAPTKTPEWRVAFDEYRKSLGAAWLSGGLGGVPGG